MYSITLVDIDFADCLAHLFKKAVKQNKSHVQSAGFVQVNLIIHIYFF